MTLIRFNYTSKLVHDFLLELTKQIEPIKKNIEMVYHCQTITRKVFIYKRQRDFLPLDSRRRGRGPEEISKSFRLSL